MKIAYEPHPVSAERKAELRAQGFKIIDAAFKPLGDVEAVGAGVVCGSVQNIIIDAAPVIKRRGRKPKAQG